jgi:RNA polymerase sigma factor (sigma-70 family)
MEIRSFNDEADQVLVGRFMRTRDEATFRALYRRHTPALYPLALLLVGGSEAEAQDAIQDTWMRACKAFTAFEWRSNLRTWLSGILIRRVHEMHREFQRRNEEELLEECTTPTNTRPGERIDLERAITRLPAGYRHVLVLHDIEGYTHQEVSTQLEISIGTSKSQLFHARRALRSMFQVRSE